MKELLEVPFGLLVFVWLATRMPTGKGSGKNITPFEGHFAHGLQEDVKVHQPEFEGLPLRGEGLELRMLRDAWEDHLRTRIASG